MFKWLRELLEIKYEARVSRLRLEQEGRKCESCEILRMQLERSNLEKDRLLNRLLEKPESIPESKPVEITPPRNIPWNVRRQILEQEDREKAKLMRDAPVPHLNNPVDVKDLEKEMGIIEDNRMKEKEREHG